MQLSEYKALANVESSHWWLRHLHFRVLRLLLLKYEHVKTRLRVLDVGCGTGGLLSILSDYSDYFELEGCEPNVWACDFARSKGLNIHNCSLEELNVDVEEFDIILCMDVFYHRFIDPNKGMQIIYSLLKSEGLLLFNVAAMPCLWRKHDDRVMGARRFLFNDLELLARKKGFLILDIYYWNSLLIFILLATSFFERIISRKQDLIEKSSLSKPPNVVNSFLILILNIETFLRRFIKFPFGSSLFLIARKPN